MCFSVTASFSSSILLGLIGARTIQVVLKRKKKYLLLALFPIIFAVQQFSEGVVWYSLLHGYPSLTALASAIFVFFALFFWQTMLPFVAWHYENNVKKRKIFLFFVFVGASFGLSCYILYFVSGNVHFTEICNHSISYQSCVPLPGKASTYAFYSAYFGSIFFYSLSLIAPPIFSSDRYVKLYGEILLLSLIITSMFYYYSLVSVWCFFAALSSLMFYFVFCRNNAVSRVLRVIKPSNNKPR